MNGKLPRNKNLRKTYASKTRCTVDLLSALEGNSFEQIYAINFTPFFIIYHMLVALVAEQVDQ